VQQAFPDCEAMREIEPEKWQPNKIEFEYEKQKLSAPPASSGRMRFDCVLET